MLDSRIRTGHIPTIMNTQLHIEPLSPHCGQVVTPAQPSLRLDALEETPVIQMFQEHGVLLFRGFDSDVEQFQRFTERLGREFSSYQGGAFRLGNLDRESIGNNKTLLTTTGAGQSFPIALHGEMYYFKQRPSLLWFYCAKPPKSKGQTTVCDAARFYEALQPATREYFQTHRIKYIRQLEAEQWRRAFQTDDLSEVRRVCESNDTLLQHNAQDDSIETEFVCSALREDPVTGRILFINNILTVAIAEWAFTSGWIEKKMSGVSQKRPPLVVRMEDGSPIPKATLKELSETAESLTADVNWLPHELLMVDNRTHMHGRREADGSERSIYVRMGEPRF